MYYRVNSGGQFSTITPTTEYRELFKRSLRHYERARCNYGPPQPIKTSIFARNELRKNRRSFALKNRKLLGSELNPEYVESNPYKDADETTPKKVEKSKSPSRFSNK